MGRLAEQLNNDPRLSEKTKRRLGLDLTDGTDILSRGEVRSQRFANTVDFIKEDLTTGATESDLENSTTGGRLAADLFQSTIGSRGLAGVAQLPGKVIAQPGALNTSKQLSQSISDISDTNLDLIKQIRDTEDQAQKDKLNSLLQDNLANIDELTRQRTEIDDKFVKTTREAVGTTGNAALLVAGGAVARGGQATQALARVPGLRNTGALTRSLIGEGVIGAGLGATEQLSRDQDVRLTDVGLSTAASVLLPFVGARVGGLVSRLTRGKAARVADSFGTVTRVVDDNLDDLVRSSNVEDIDSILGKDLDNALKSLDPEESAEFKQEILNSIASITDEDQLVGYTESLARLVNLRSLDELAAPGVRAANESELAAVKRQRADLEQQVKELIGDVDESKIDEFVNNTSRIDELERTIASFEGRDVSNLSQLQLQTRRNAIEELTNLRNANNDLLPNVQSKGPALVQLRNRLAQVNTLEQSIVNRIGAENRVSSIVDNPEFVASELDDIVITQTTRTGQEIKKTVPNPRKLADGSEKRNTQLRSQRYDKKAGRRNIIQGLNDWLNDKFVTQIRKLEVLQRQDAEIVDATDAVNSFHLRSDAIGAKNRFDSSIFDSIDNRIKRISPTKKGTEEVSNDVSVYLLAKHAPHVNAKKGNLPGQIKELVDLEDIKNVPSDEVAAKIVAHLDNKYKGDEVFFGIVNDVRNFNKGKLKELLDNKLIDSKFAKQLEDDYPWYVPLYRDLAQEGAEGFIPASGKIDNTIRTLYGSELPILNVVDASLYKGQKVNKAIVNNGVRQKYGRQIAKNLADGVEGYKDFSIKESTGFVPDDNKFRFEFTGVDGKKYTVAHADPDLIKPFQFIPDQDNAVLRVFSYIGKYTTFASQLLTRFNPDFKLKSFVRDGLESMVIYDGLGGTGALSPSRIARAGKGIEDFLGGVDSVGSRTYKEALEDGIGFGTYSAYLNSKNQFKGGVSDKLKNTSLKSATNAIDNINEVLENSIRFAHYNNARANGFTRLQAATLAKEAGINFSKTGKATKYFAPLYMFFNATIQGNVNMLRAMANPRTALKTGVLTSAAAGSQELINSSIDPNWRDKVDKFQQDSNVIVVLGTKANGELRYAKVPVPLALKPLWVLENNAIRYQKGQISGSTGVYEVAEELVTTFNPTGGRVTDQATRGLSFEEIGTSIVPTIGKPLANVQRNKNFFGSEIIRYDTDPETGELVARELSDSFGDTNDERIALKMSELLRSAIGGEGKWTDPRAIKEIFRGYAYMGLFREADKAVEAIDGLIKNEGIDANALPVVNEFFGNSREDTQFARDFYKLQEDIRLTDDPELKKQIMFEQVLRDTTPEKLGWSPASKLKNAGLDVPKIYTGKFSNQQGNAEFALFLSQQSDDQEIQDKKEVYLKRLSFEKPEEYKRYVEFEAAAKGMLNRPDEDIIEFFADRGIQLSRSKKNGTIDRRFMEDKYYTLKRIQSDDPSVLNTYNTFEEVKKEISRGNTPSIQEMLEVTESQKRLLESGYISERTYEKKVQQQFNDWTDGVGRDLITEFETGDIDIEGLVEKAKGYNSTDINKYVRDYLVRNGYNK